MVAKLFNIKSFIDDISDEKIRQFFQVAFSETVRESSNTRNDEFKLYRYNEETLRKFNPNVYGIMAQKLTRNRAGLGKFLSLLNHFNRVPTSLVYGFNSVAGIPEEMVPTESADIVVTSPPYGDSHTTVAYGQFSRLSSAWLGFEDAGKIDSILMGGKVHTKIVPEFPCDQLNEALTRIAKADEKRAWEVASFYVDYFKSIKHVAGVVKPGGYACYVVGNRKVKGVVLPIWGGGHLGFLVSPLNQLFRNLHCIRRGAFTDVVRDDPHVQRIRSGLVAPDSTHKYFVLVVSI